jgi:hypothetical protein
LDEDFGARDPFRFPDSFRTFWAGALAAFFVGAFWAGALAAFFVGAFFVDALLWGRAFTLPTTTKDPMDGMIVDSSPLDHVTCTRAPLTPVTTPSRGVWPTLFEGT